MTRSRLLAALVLAVLLALGFFGYRTYVLRYSDDKLAAAYTPDLTVDPPAADTTIYAEGLRWLAEDGYSQATAALNRIARTDPNYPSAQYYAGVAYYRNQQLNAARTALLNATDIGPSTVAEDAEWLLLMTYLKSGRTEREFYQLLARLIERATHAYHAQALSLRDDLESSWRRRWETLAYGQATY